MAPRRRCHYVLSSHWDREWYQTFQNYRYQLVRLIDTLLEGWNDGRLRGPFTCDGQAILLEDYLEVRPERRAEVEARTREGKFVLGPWYVMPDEFLVSGESLIRNIEMGRRLARAFGAEPSNAGFACDLFGHNSQMPQIFAGFGVRAGLIWRGTNATETRQAFWIGADGTKLPCYRFGFVGYCDYANDVREANKLDRAFDRERVAQNLETFVKNEAEAAAVDPVLLFDGGDHQNWDPRAYEVLAARMDNPDDEFEIVHTSLDAYLDEMLTQVDRIRTTFTGELREPGRAHDGKCEQWLIPGVGSSRVRHKQANAECETLLCHWAEPTSAFSSRLFGAEYPHGFLDVAWKYLIKNHPHDSICGCSLDRVHRDMLYRFDQCRDIADRLTSEAMLHVASAVDPVPAEGEIRVAVFNPLPRPVAEPVDLALRLPMDWPKFAEFFGFEPLTSFTIHDTEGQEIPYQRTAQVGGRVVRGWIQPDKFTPPAFLDEVRLTLPLEIPATGYTTLVVRRGAARKPVRHPVARGLATDHRTLENEFLRVAVESNGTLTLTDKRTGQSYTDLLTFEDQADIGDGWFHGLALDDQVFSSTAARADVALVHNGPLKASLRIRVTMGVPAFFDPKTQTRSETFADLVVDSLVTLRAGGDRVEVETTVHNNAGDHRLRVLLPTGARTDHYHADSAFDVVRRPIALREDNHLYRELEIEAKPMVSFAAVNDDARGLAVVSSGLLECAARDLPERPLVLTLFRATHRTVMTNGEPDGQLQGKLDFRYWIVPVSGSLDAVRLLETGQRLAAGIRLEQIPAEHVAQYRRGRSLPPAAGMFRVEGPVVVTSARQVGAGLEIRVFNPTDTEAEARLHLLEAFPDARPAAASRVDFDGRTAAGDFEYADGVLRLTLGPRKIATVRLT